MSDIKSCRMIGFGVNWYFENFIFIFKIFKRPRLDLKMLVTLSIYFSLNSNLWLNHAYIASTSIFPLQVFNSS